jgi:UDP-GlcNAc3NAcA epimerase
MKKIVTILGARPQFIKASLVSHAIANSGEMNEVLVHTGQHFDKNMSGIFFDELNIPRPDYFLNINGGGHAAMTGRMLIEVEQVLLKERPDVVLVYGDTNSTLAGAIAAIKLHIPVAHIEAGLRSFNMVMPEEVNRILTDRISRWLFAPTITAVKHLNSEGITPEQIYLVGDVMYDVSLYFGQRVQHGTGLMARLGLTPKSYVLATIHRAENADNPRRLGVIVDALIATAKILPVVWPIHPRTRDALKKTGKLYSLSKKIHLIDPVSYLEMVQLEKFAALVTTDSGGVQKEAFFYQVPCVTLRDETEWVELIDSGWNRLAPPISSDNVIHIIKDALNDNYLTNLNPYGKGDASSLIARILLESNL